MKSHAHFLVWPHHGWTALAESSVETKRRATKVPNYQESPTRAPGLNKSLSVPLRTVGVLAFCHALVFLVLFLFVCAWAGASTVARPALDMRLIVSSYVPTKARNPFGSEPSNAAEDPSAKSKRIITPGLLKLNGLLYDPVHPSAVVNGQLVEPRKPVSVPTEQGQIEVKALQITRESILLEIGDQKVGLWLSGHEPDKQK